MKCQRTWYENTAKQARPENKKNKNLTKKADRSSEQCDARTSERLQEQHTHIRVVYSVQFICKCCPLFRDKNYLELELNYLRSGKRDIAGLHPRLPHDDMCMLYDKSVYSSYSPVPIGVSILQIQYCTKYIGLSVRPMKTHVIRHYFLFLQASTKNAVLPCFQLAPLQKKSTHTTDWGTARECISFGGKHSYCMLGDFAGSLDGRQSPARVMSKMFAALWPRNGRSRLNAKTYEQS